MTLKQYRERWRARRLDALEADILGADPQHRNVRACFDLSFRDLSVPAQRLLVVMSVWEGREFALEHLAKVGGPDLWLERVSGHDGPVSAWIRPRGDGPWVVTGGRDGRVLLWREEGNGATCVETVAQGLAPLADLVQDSTGRLLAQDDTGYCVPFRVDADGGVQRQEPRPGSGRRWQVGAAGEPYWLVPVGKDNVRVDVLDWCYWDSAPKVEAPTSAPLPAWLDLHCQPDPPPPTVDELRALAGCLGRGHRGRFSTRLAELAPGTPLAELAQELAKDETPAQRAREASASGHAADELRRVVADELLGASLVTERMTAESLRLRLHSLVSEFAATYLEASAARQRRGTQETLYLDLLKTPFAAAKGSPSGSRPPWTFQRQTAASMLSPRCRPPSRTACSETSARWRFSRAWHPQMQTRCGSCPRSRCPPRTAGTSLAWARSAGSTRPTLRRTTCSHRRARPGPTSSSGPARSCNAAPSPRRHRHGRQAEAPRATAR